MHPGVEHVRDWFSDVHDGVHVVPELQASTSAKGLRFDLCVAFAHPPPLDVSGLTFGYLNPKVDVGTNGDGGNRNVRYGERSGNGSR